MGTGDLNAGSGNPAMDWHPIQGGVEILLVTSCYRDQDKLRPDGALGSNVDLTFTLPKQGHNQDFSKGVTLYQSEGTYQTVMSFSPTIVHVGCLLYKGGRGGGGYKPTPGPAPCLRPCLRKLEAWHIYKFSYILYFALLPVFLVLITA